MARRYLIRTFGCQMNQHDSERIAGLLEADGMVATTDEADADVIVMNTCCIRESADTKLYGTLGNLKPLKDANPDLQIVVGGCLAQKDAERIQQRAGYVDVVFGTHNVTRAVELLDEARTSGPVMEILEAASRDDNEAFPSALGTARDVDHAAWVTIQIGCDNNCAFCIVPAVRGPEVSRPFGQLVDEVGQLARQGVFEITLLGQNVNSYGRDITLSLRTPGIEQPDQTRSGSTDRVEELAGERWAADPSRRPMPLFADLLRAVGDVEGIERVRFVSPHPKDLRRETIEAMAEVDSVVEHLHLPLQSGSDRVLAAMHRGYTAGRYLERLGDARARIDDLAVTTDIIVGFPGETEDEFSATLEVAAEAEYDSAYTFIYSPREGTEAAAAVEEFIAPEVSGARYDRLIDVIDRSGLRRHRERIGRTEQVVVQGPNHRRAGQIDGRTRQNKLVHFKHDEPLATGSRALVTITDAGTHHLKGELVEVQAVPSRRRSIPVAAS
jgi:tRNA-2-methylthio-N6-dimethylallyladenosine synthase